MRLQRIKVLALIALLAIAAGCVRHRPPAEDGVLVISQEQQASWVRNFNPLSPATAPRFPTISGVYEPLYVFNSVHSEFVPWLALRHTWSEGNRLLTFTTRSGVSWSDGRPFSARDVAFTFNLLAKFPALDRGNVWDRLLESVEAPDDTTVELRFKRVFVPGMEELVAQQIVPEHIWSTIEDPVAFPNENPVGTGPFTEVNVFRNQIYELGRNPHYWQPGKPQVKALRFPAFPSNDRANLALAFGEVDWAGNFIPAVDRVYVARRPEAHRYWFPLTGSMVFLYANTTRAPFDDSRVRRALSLAIDRDLLVDVAAYRYSRPSDPTALSDAYASWRDPEAVANRDWVDYNPDRARELLGQAGLTPGADGYLAGPNGPATYQILVVSGWSDWVRAAQVIARGLQEAGINASVRTYDFGAWFQRLQEGDFDLAIGWSFDGPTPYSFYRWLMATDTVEPIGTPAIGNWHRFGSARADSLLAAYEVETDPERLHELMAGLQRVFVAEAPAIPLYPNPSWAEYSTARFENFPTPENPYADPSPNKFGRGETLLVLTNLIPR